MGRGKGIGLSSRAEMTGADAYLLFLYAPIAGAVGFTSGPK